MNFLKKIWLSGKRSESYRSAARIRRKRRQLLVENLESRRLMAIMEVNTTSDVVDPSDGLFSLREAIQFANQSAESDKIVFSESITSSGPATIALSGSELSISSAIEIVGPTNNPLTIDAGRRSRVFHIGGHEVTISNLRMIGGQSTESGGAIYSGGTLILIGSTIADSSATFWGGAIYNNGGVLNIWESALSNNNAFIGGAIMSHGVLSVVDSTIAQNKVSNAGAGIYFDRAGSHFILINSTIAGNVADSSVGGIGVGSTSNVQVANTIVAGNTLKDGSPSDIAGLAQSGVSYSMIGSYVNTNWYNSIQSNIVGIDWKTVLENDGTRPLLKNNGGRSETIAILPGSRAIDAGYGALFEDIATRTDQRGAGYPRIARREIDMGAFERPRELVTVTITPSSPRYTDGAVQFTAAVTAKDPTVTQIPTGTIQFAGYVSANREHPIGSQNSTVVDGKATWAFGESSYGVYRLEATYVGDHTFQSGDAPKFIRNGQIVDYGDAPSAAQSGFASSYPVTLDQDGARHSANRGYYIGKSLDEELDGLPSSGAVSDTNDDGIQWLTPLIASSVPTVASIVVDTYFHDSPVRPKLDAWIDFNRDGDWNDPGEQVFQSVSLEKWYTLLAFTVPAGVSVGQTAARFRVSSGGGLSPTGPAYDGEVEDYMVSLASDAGAGLVFNSDTSTVVSEILVVNDETILKDSAGKVFFKAPRSQASQVELDVSTSTKKNVNNLSLTTTGRFAVDLNATHDSIRLLGSGQTPSLDLRYAVADRQYARIDISGTGNNTLTLNSALTRMGIRHDAGDTVVATWTRVSMPEVIDGRFVHLVGYSTYATIELDNPTPYLNPKNKFDADLDGGVAPVDVLSTINSMTRFGSREMVAPTTVDPSTWRYTDINGDGAQSPIDVLVLINELRRLSIPIPSYGVYGSGSSGTFNSLIFDNSSVVTSSGSLIYRGTGSATDRLLQLSSNGNLSGTYQVLGSITVNSNAVINNPTKMTVRGYRITINPYQSLNGSSSGGTATVGSFVTLGSDTFITQTWNVLPNSGQLGTINLG